MSNPNENAHYRLTGDVYWKLKSNVVLGFDCDYCGGAGEVGGGLKSLDGPQNCPKCFGSGRLKNPEIPPCPPVPERLILKMKAALSEWLSEQDSAPSEENYEDDIAKGEM